MKTIFGVSGFCVAALFVVTSAQAAVIQIDQGAEYSSSYDHGGMGAGRGVSFLANQNFGISTIGVDLSVTSTNTTTYQYQIFASANGQTPGALLASTSFQLSAGDGYRDQAISFDFTAGSYYVVNFSRVDGVGLGSNVGTHYAWLSSGGVSAAINYGPLTVVKGFEGANATNNNPLIPFTELGVGEVPEPASWALMLTGFGMVGAAMRRRSAFVSA